MTQHRTREEAVEQLRSALRELDPDGSVPWAEVERRAITHDPEANDPDGYRLAEGTELEQLVGRLRDHP